MAPPKSSAKKFVFGIGALVGLVVILLVAFTANQQRLPWTQTTKIRAEFADIGQLQVGSQVRQNGLTVGQVSDIRLENGRVTVTMDVNNAQPMYRDGYAGIWDQSSLALKFVELRSGTPASGQLGDGVLPVTQTESTHDLVAVLGIFDEPTRVALGNALRQLGGGMAGYGPGLHDFTASLPVSLASAQTISETLVDGRTDLPGLMRSTDQLMSRFAGREQLINSMLKQTDETLRAIGTDNGQPLGAFVSKLPHALVEVRGAMDAANAPLADLAVATHDIGPGAASLGRATGDVRGVFREAPAALDAVPDFTDEANPAVDNLRSTFSDLRPFVPRLGDGIKYARTPLRELKPYAVDIGSFFTDLESLITGHEAWTHHFRAMVTVPTLTNVDGAPVKDAVTPYPQPGQAYRQRDPNGGEVPELFGATPGRK